ncbi:GntR family transcriptional regulator [Amphibacillus marinus]|uniref:GntR family transcriptional regulator n=1 Tax=Amphibacillus marinus TaxID=872970 RepID=A0A1H8JUT3_9BACI|nr:GntR family transcriptional regulator [Amphibacillus marinus]SEN84459.1 GntR family transcriptional regulator [Amphibacillus marinus]
MKPQYIRIKEELELDIEAGRFRIGDRLPAEVELAKQFKVSRVTVRAAIQRLANEGKLDVKHGVGTFVVNQLPIMPNSLEKLMSITDMIKHAGLEDGEQREKLVIEQPEKDWAKQLNLLSDDEVIIHERIRTANNEPVVFSKNIIPAKLVKDDIIQKGSIGSLFQYLQSIAKISIRHATSEIIVPLHTDQNCQKLLIHPDSTVLLLKQLHYDRHNIPVLYSFDYFRNDVFKFTISRTRIDY